MAWTVLPVTWPFGYMDDAGLHRSTRHMGPLKNKTSLLEVSSVKQQPRYIHTHKYMCIHIYVYAKTYIYLYTYTCTQIQIRTYVHICICICISRHTEQVSQAAGPLKGKPARRPEADDSEPVRSPLQPHVSILFGSQFFTIIHCLRYIILC